MERRTVVPILSLERIDSPFSLSLYNQALAADHAQPLRLRRQAIKV
jgi:hypothetical protein